MNAVILPEREQLAQALKLVRQIQERLRLTRWSSALVSRRYGKRSAQKILSSREINYMATCLDLTFALTHRLKENGFKPTFVVDELIGEQTNKPTLHFAVEIEIAGKPHTIDFAANKSVLFYDGSFNHGRAFPGLEQLNVQKFSTEGLQPHETPMQFLGVKRLREIHKKFPKVKYRHLRDILRQMKKADSEKLFGILQARRPRIVATLHPPANPGRAVH